MGRFNLKDEKDFQNVKYEAESSYAAIGDVYCPYFGEKIAFNAKGLRHLKFKSDQQARTQEDQYARLKLLRLALKVLELSRTLQGVWHTKRFEATKTHSRWEHVMKQISFYEFIAVLDNVRVKVIVKEVAGGEKHFWSIIPFWKVNKENSSRILYCGEADLD
jgi:hypothetical protein